MPRTLASLLTDLQHAYPDRPVPQPTLALYARELDGIPSEVLDAAVREIIRTETRFPTLAVILGRCAEHTLRLPSEAEALAQIEARIAWGQGRRGDDATPFVNDLVYQALDKVGGFAAYRTADQPGIIRSQFLNLYREMRAAETRHFVLTGLRKEIGR